MQSERTSASAAWHLLVIVSTVALTGCQTAVWRQHVPRWPHSHACRASACVPSGSCSAAQPASYSGVSAAGPDSQSATPAITSAEPIATVLSDTDAMEMFRRLRGKLRSDDNGTVVEADLSYSDVNDDALASIEIFREIKELDLTGTQVHDQSLVVLQQLPKLQSLKLKGTPISSLGMATLTRISSLVLLDASNTAVSDEGFNQASAWTNLRYLSLNNTSVTDAAIPYLTTIKTLKGLSLLNTPVTAEGARQLKESLPDCLIVIKAESESGPAAAVDPLRPVPAQIGVAFPNFPPVPDRQLEQLVELAGKQPQLAEHLAAVYADREQWSQAARILAAAVAVDPSQPSLQYSLGLALARSGDINAAEIHLTQAVGAADASYDLGLIEYENSLRVCAAHFRQAVAADPSLTVAQTRLCEMQQELAALKQRRRSVRGTSHNSAQYADTPLEVIPAAPVRPATHSKSWPR
ncbi:MAG: hypothetical protein KDB01_08775 [Planctomycetaceae bacterium]|nr:hypothetical protein [Planctomycetaceae bacterium]